MLPCGNSPQKADERFETRAKRQTVVLRRRRSARGFLLLFDDRAQASRTKTAAGDALHIGLNLGQYRQIGTPASLIRGPIDHAARKPRAAACASAHGSSFSGFVSPVNGNSRIARCSSAIWPLKFVQAVQTIKCSRIWARSANDKSRSSPSDTSRCISLQVGIKPFDLLFMMGPKN